MEKKKDVLKRLDLKKKAKQYLKLKKLLIVLSLNKKEKIKQIKNIISIPKKDDVYKPIKIYDAFDDNFAEYKGSSKKDKSVSISGYLNNIREY